MGDAGERGTFELFEDAPMGDPLPGQTARGFMRAEYMAPIVQCMEKAGYHRPDRSRAVAAM